MHETDPLQRMADEMYERERAEDRPLDLADEERDLAEEAYWAGYCQACGASGCTWDGVPDGFHADLPEAMPGEVTIDEASGLEAGE